MVGTRLGSYDHEQDHPILFVVFDLFVPWWLPLAATQTRGPGHES